MLKDTDDGPVDLLLNALSEFNLVVDFGERKPAANGCEFNGALKTTGCCEQPLAIGLPGELLDVRFVLGNKDVSGSR